MGDDITKEHALYTAEKSIWEKVDDICDRENLQSYLVEINPTDKTAENKARNDSYYERAIFYGITGQTSRAMCGMPFRKMPAVNVPETLSLIKSNIDGNGTTIVQQSKALIKSLIRKGRAGLLVDYPINTDGPASIEDIKQGRMFPVILRFEPEQVIYWETKNIGSKNILCKVVIFASEYVAGEESTYYIELYLDESNLYVYREWEEDANGEMYIRKTAEPTAGNGMRLDYIPFTFIGSENNNPTIDTAPLYNMSEIEIGHWNNSAEHEDIVFQCGQPQPWASGYDQTQLAEMKAGGFYLGGRMLMPVPAGEQFGYAQISPNTAASDAMEKKEEKMLSLGAMLIQQGSTQKTATQYEGEINVSHSVLSLIVSNVNDAYKLCLQWYANFQNDTLKPDEYPYLISTDFVPRVIDAQVLQSVFAAYQGSAVTQSAWIKFLQKYNLEDSEKTVEEISEELDTLPSMPDLNAEG